MFVAFCDCCQKLPELQGQTVSLNGRLFINEKAYLADSYQGLMRGEFLLVVDDERLICNHLTRTLPVYGGGLFTYFNEPALVTGVLSVGPDGYQLSRISYCRIVRDEFDILVPFQPAGEEKGAGVDRESLILVDKGRPLCESPHPSPPRK